jgi:hypothetical protein
MVLLIEPVPEGIDQRLEVALGLVRARALLITLLIPPNPVLRFLNLLSGKGRRSIVHAVHPVQGVWNAAHFLHLLRLDCLICALLS